MKAELRLADHSVIPGEKVVEIWFDGRFIGQVTGADGPGVRVISKHKIETKKHMLAVEVLMDESFIWEVFR